MNAFSSRKAFTLVASLFVALMTGCAASPDNDGEQDGTQEIAQAPAAASEGGGDQKGEQLNPMGITWGTGSYDHYDLRDRYRCHELALNGLEALENGGLVRAQVQGAVQFGDALMRHDLRSLGHRLTDHR